MPSKEGEGAAYARFTALATSEATRTLRTMSRPEPTLRPGGLPIVSRRLPTGELVELVYDSESKRTQFAVGKGEDVHLVDRYEAPEGQLLVPYSPQNNLIRHEVLLLASRPEPFGCVSDLVSRIEAYLTRYVDLSEGFQALAAYYILLTWVYDAFNEVPYLRFRGDFGSGKSRALFVVGSLCSKAFFASGASTVSPIFHTLDTFRGTLLFDEADFRFSDEKAELVKILNNGNVRGFPVLRTAVTQKREFEPRAFSVFGPKLVAMRYSFEDEALESRFFTEEMGRRPLPADIPINLPDAQKEEARAIRNELLGYRFTMLGKLQAEPALVDPALTPRMNQILVPLLSVVENEGAREEIRRTALAQQAFAHTSQTANVAREIVAVLTELFEAGEDRIPVGRIAALLIERIGDVVARPITGRFVGEVLRERLGITPYKSHGTFVVSASMRDRIEVVASAP